MRRKYRAPIIPCLGPKCDNEQLIELLWEVYLWASDYQDAECLLCGYTHEHDQSCALEQVRLLTASDK